MGTRFSMKTMGPLCSTTGSDKPNGASSRSTGNVRRSFKQFPAPLPCELAKKGPTQEDWNRIKEEFNKVKVEAASEGSMEATVIKFSVVILEPNGTKARFGIYYSDCHEATVYNVNWCNDLKDLAAVALAAPDEEAESDSLGNTMGAAGRRHSRRGGRPPSREVRDDTEAAGSSVGPAWSIVEAEAGKARRAPGATGEAPAPQTHILVDLLRDSDFYHASAAVRSGRQRSKKQLLSAERFAELSLLRQSGWRVCCIPEHLWSLGPDGDAEASHANRELVFRLVAGLEEKN